MDLESESSALESTGDNDLVCSANPPICDDVKIEFNGSYLHDNGCDRNSCGNGHPLPSLVPVRIKDDVNKLNSDDADFPVINSVRKYTENGQLNGVSPVPPSSPPVRSPGMSPLLAGSKGKGLRKWRRIRRESCDITSGSSADIDVTNKDLKRRSANLGNSLELGAEMKQKSEGDGSVSSTNAFVSNPVGADSFSNAGSSSVYKVVGISAFSVGTDSDNSEDRSSKSSTAASMPKSRLDQSRATSHSREKYRMKHMVRKSLSNTPQVQQGARQLESGNKSRGDTVNLDKENSLSSLESNSRNYSSVFKQGSSSVINNGHSERLMGSDGEHSDDEPAGEEQSVEGLPTVPSGSVGEGEETSRDDAALSFQIGEKIKNHKILGNGDPLIDCVQMLQSAREVFELELQKFGDLGKDLRPLDDDFIKATGLPIYSKYVDSEVHTAASNWPTPDALDVFEAKSVSQAQNVKALEKQLEKATAMLKEKESRVTELEATINDMKSSSEELGRSAQAQQKKYNEIEVEMEALFKQKMEAEIKYLAIADKTIISERQMKLLLEQQKSAVSKQAQEANKRGDLESKSASLEDKADEEGLSTRWVTSVAELQKMQSRVSKFSTCFVIQLVLFVFVVKLFLSQLLPKSEVVMPT